MARRETISETLVTIILLNWNGLHFLDSCLATLMKQITPSYEVIMVDNGSSDESVEFVAHSYPSVRIVENSENLGFAEGNNVGLRLATGKYVILLNIDTRVPPNFIRTLVDRASHDERIGSVGCKIVQEDGTSRYGPLVTNHGFLVPLLAGNSTVLRQRVQRLFDLDGHCITNCATAVLYNRHALEVTGAFDAELWSDWEDHDLGFRLWTAGYRNVYTTKTHVLHVGGGSFGRTLSKDRYVRIIRNMLTTYFKNYETPNLLTRFLFLFWVILPIRHFASIIVYELGRLSIKPPSGSAPVSRQTYLALPEAYIQFIRNLPTTMRRRHDVQAKRKTPDSLIFSMTSRNWII